MRVRRRRSSLLALMLCAAAGARAGRRRACACCSIGIERVVRGRRRGRPTSRCCPPAPSRERALDFAASELMPGVNRSVLQERDRMPLPGTPPGNGYRLMVDVMSPSSDRGRASRPGSSTSSAPAPPAPRPNGPSPTRSGSRRSRTSTASSLNAAKQYAAHNLKIAAEDLDLTLPEGSVFVAEIDGGVTAVVLLGKRHAQLPPGAGDRKGAGQDLLRQRDARDALRRGLHPR